LYGFALSQPAIFVSPKRDNQSITFQTRNTMKKLTATQTATINGSGPVIQ